MTNATPLFPPCADGTRLGLGGAPLGNLFHAISEVAASELVCAAIADGCEAFDTAPHYGHGLSEHRIGAAVRVSSAEPTISSKVGRLLVADVNAAREQHSYVDILPFNQHWDYSAGGVRRSVADSLQRLGRARLGAVFVHDCDRANHGATYPAVLDQVVGEALPELRRMVDEGVIAAVGLGVNDVQVCCDVLDRADLDCLLLAGRYSLLDQEALPLLLPLCVKRGVRIALGGVFNSGILATGVGVGPDRPRFNYAAASDAWTEKTRRLELICREFSVPLRAAALQFPLAHPAVEIVMVGAQSVAQWRDTRAMMSLEIPAPFWRALRGRNLVPADAPLPGDA